MFTSADSSGSELRVVLEEVPELGLLLVADRLLERDGRLRAAADLLDLVVAEIDLARDLGRRRLAPELGAQLALGAHDLVELLDDVDGHADRPRLVGERPRDGLADPPRRVGRELEPLAVVELLRRAHEPDRALLDQVEERAAPGCGSASRSRRRGAGSPRPSPASRCGRRARSASRARPPGRRSAARPCRCPSGRAEARRSRPRVPREPPLPPPRPGRVRRPRSEARRAPGRSRRSPSRRARARRARPAISSIVTEPGLLRRLEQALGLVRLEQLRDPHRLRT